ncbi:MAG: 50S ribosomal protein L9 [Alphaproteobacteria bacterium]|nr:MAG: 50S ribosomal protein L9 [Alphaproteobacteria bacterium]
MDVILLEHVARLGAVGDVVGVKGGYGRNFLIPQGKALRATKKNVEDFAARKEALLKQNAELRAAAEKNAATLGDLAVKIVRQASEDGRLFGSVGVRDVVAALVQGGHVFDRTQVDLDGVVKSLGVFHATIRLHPEVRVKCRIDVVRNAD